jgi:enoyl-CoA hydratase/carnithine racemase
MSQPVQASTERGVLTLTLDRPETRNALSSDLIARLIDALATAAHDPRVRGSS